jgi:hypothetical protein
MANGSLYKEDFTMSTLAPIQNVGRERRLFEAGAWDGAFRDLWGWSRIALEHVESLTVARRLGLAAAQSRIRGINVLAKRPPPGQIPVRIKQVLYNLLSNAMMMFTPDRGRHDRNHHV